MLPLAALARYRDILCHTFESLLHGLHWTQHQQHVPPLQCTLRVFLSANTRKMYTLVSFGQNKAQRKCPATAARAAQLVARQMPSWSRQERKRSRNEGSWSQQEEQEEECSGLLKSSTDHCVKEYRPLGGRRRWNWARVRWGIKKLA